MKAIIVDDEPKAIELIAGYLQHFSRIELAGTFRNGLKAFEFINSNKVDLIFLDINMPHFSGISLAKMIAGETKIIFTTAFSEYAAESYDVEAVDYLLKPISMERFAIAMGKVLSNNESNLKYEDNVLMIKSGARIYRVEPGEILYLHKEGNYMTYHLKNKRILARESIGDALNALPAFFIQIHKSYIVNLRKIEFFNKEEIRVNGETLPLGDSYREHFIQATKTAL